ncbi:MAG: T9SS type A sorting domain-containing protein [Candidatus Marinimicrobia bacterium]|nr:T9SS type A sorting domain-containing protein [Candidatus Neomarinimicrobiota bacterium]
MIKSTQLISITMLLFSSIFSQNILSFEYLGGDSLNINLINDEDVAGFEIKITGVDIISASGGSAEANGFLMSVSGSTVIGFSFTGSTISPNDSLLFTLHFNLDSDADNACFSDDSHGPINLISESCPVTCDACEENDDECEDAPTTAIDVLYDDCADAVVALGCDFELGALPDCILSNPSGDILDNGLALGECVDGCFDYLACNYLTPDSCEYSIPYYQDADGDGFGNLDVTENSCFPIEDYVTNGDDDDDTCLGEISEIDGFCCESSTFDNCGICDGGGPLENFDCDGNCLIEIDCAGDCGGLAVLDDCGVCNGNNASMDACENCGGDCVTALTNFVVCSPTVCSDDDDVNCNSNSSNLVVADCLGECGGDVAFDSCGDCNGNNASMDACGNCGGDCITDINGTIVCNGIATTPENLVIADCNGVCGGLAFIDSCESCVSGDTGESQCLSLDVNMVYKVSITSAYPNPFNPSINIEYSVASVGHVILKIIGLDGKHINTITNSIQTQGLYNVQWTPENISSGMYLIQLEANSQIQNKKIIYLK